MTSQLAKFISKSVIFIFDGCFVWSVWQVEAKTLCSCTLNYWKVNSWTCKRARKRKIGDLRKGLISLKSIFYRYFNQFSMAFFASWIFLHFKLLRNLYLQHRRSSRFALNYWLYLRSGLAKKRKNFALFFCGEKIVLAKFFEEWNPFGKQKKRWKPKHLQFSFHLRSFTLFH